VCFSIYAISSHCGNWALEVWEVGTGTWFDLAWTAPFAILAVCAAEWQSAAPDNDPVITEQIELPVPGLLSFAVITIAVLALRSRPLLSSLTALISFAILLSRTYLAAASATQEAEDTCSSTGDVSRGPVPICAACKMIRDGAGNWNPIETYISDCYGINFSHGICDFCHQRLYPNYSLE
jgi:hypothetical protein